MDGRIPNGDFGPTNMNPVCQLPHYQRRPGALASTSGMCRLIGQGSAPIPDQLASYYLVSIKFLDYWTRFEWCSLALFAGNTILLQNIALYYISA